MNNIAQTTNQKNLQADLAPKIKVRLCCIEDGLDNIGFRKLSAYVKSIHPETEITYVPTGNLKGYISLMSEKDSSNLVSKDILNIAKRLAESDIVGFCSMTQYASTVTEIIAELRKLNPKVYIIWGGIHPIIHPEDAIKYADAICTGEGEFAFKKFLELFEKGEDVTTTPSFWFNKKDKIIKNANVTLMTGNEMDKLPPLTYHDSELIYQRHIGEFKNINYHDYMSFTGLSYNTVWSIGCPLMCTYCGNSKFIEYDPGYRRLRHSSPRTIIDEVKRAITKQPHLSTIVFHDDSFMALPYAVLEEFCDLYKKEVNIPFAVFGIIPNYVKENKIALLIDAGMNRIRMGIQSGSENILEFYKRPTKLKKIHEATKIFNRFKKYMIPPAYDIILENPVETDEDTLATVDMLYNMPRPFTLNIFALRVIPNTILAKDLEERGLDIPSITKNYNIEYHRTLGNMLVFAIVVMKIPKWFYKKLRPKIHRVMKEQTQYPILFKIFRISYLIKRGLDHLRFMDFSVLPGKTGYFLWKIGVIKFWQRHILKRYDITKDIDLIKRNQLAKNKANSMPEISVPGNALNAMISEIDLDKKTH